MIQILLTNKDRHVSINHMIRCVVWPSTYLQISIYTTLGTTNATNRKYYSYEISTIN